VGLSAAHSPFQVQVSPFSHARLLSPSQALDLGLLHRVFPAADFEQEVEC